jgi:hypothetical protein
MPKVDIKILSYEEAYSPLLYDGAIPPLQDRDQQLAPADALKLRRRKTLYLLVAKSKNE